MSSSPFSLGDGVPPPEFGDVNNNNTTKNGENGNILRTFEATTCSFCSVDLLPGMGFLLDRCLHPFCKDCLISTIEGSTSSQISCPLHSECGGVLLDTEVKALISPTAFKTYLDRSLVNFMNENGGGDGQNNLTTSGSGGALHLVQCGNIDCQEFNNATNLVDDEFTCHTCQMITCLICKKSRFESYGLCGCLKRDSSSDLNSLKKVKIDPEVAKDWEEKWSQLMASASSQNSGSSSQNDTDALLALALGIEESGLLISQQEFDCSICLCQVEKGQGVILKECFHCFCKQCLSTLIGSSEGATVPCPHRINDDACPSIISDREVKYLVSPEVYESFLKRSVTQAELSMPNSFHCRSVNCNAWWELVNEDGDGDEMGGETTCPVCKKRNCLKCKAIHEAVSCEEYQQQLAQDEMDIKTKGLLQKKVARGLVMKCPTCKVMIEKNGGCSHMYCTYCKTHFNWMADKKVNSETSTTGRPSLFIPIAAKGFGGVDQDARGQDYVYRHPRGRPPGIVYPVFPPRPAPPTPPRRPDPRPVRRRSRDRSQRRRERDRSGGEDQGRTRH